MTPPVEVTVATPIEALIIILLRSLLVFIPKLLAVVSTRIAASILFPLKKRNPILNKETGKMIIVCFQELLLKLPKSQYII